MSVELQPGPTQPGWLANGEQVINAAVTAFLWGAGAHVVYLAAVPEALRVTVAQRNVRLWQGLTIGALMTAAVYDAVQNRRLNKQSAILASETKRLRAQLKQ